ncbi:hypothetical protein [Stieleria mannarensis]|uniref:hypothetical protein n=1 Tax=Stieleria mannarensis TaxID=2755585 RepID=UPI0016027C25|nr:hypothetical protein [Rhodopirellula sp. JC639]
MTRSLLCVIALACVVFVVPGCGRGSGEATIEDTTAQTPEEVQEAEDYEEMLRKQEQENFKKK